MLLSKTELNQRVISILKHSVRFALAGFMIFAGSGHFTNTESFTAQVPPFLPGTEMIVYVSGVIEIVLGLGLAFWKSQRVNFGVALAIFYILIFPGNISQFVTQTSAFGLDTDIARAIRLLFQPVLVVAALWCTDAFADFRKLILKGKDRLSNRR